MPQLGTGSRNELKGTHAMTQPLARPDNDVDSTSPHAPAVEAWLNAKDREAEAWMAS